MSMTNQKLERVGEVFNATFTRITPEMKALGCWATVHKTTEVSIPSTVGDYPPRRAYYTLCGKEYFYQMQPTTEPVNCKTCLRMKAQ